MDLKIVWRNPLPVRHIQRWEPVEKDDDKSVYVIQEYVMDGNRGYWATECELQVIHGGNAA